MGEDYIHGYSRQEQQRLIEQAAVLAPNVFAGLELTASRRLLEIGCGVGAELEQIGTRWPLIELTGLDRNAGHLSAARAYLFSRIPHSKVRLVRGDAYALPFPTASFDTVITIWMLEHVADPRIILAEALRVLTPGGRLICTEVDNGSFAFDPVVPTITDWWALFNHYQQSNGGNPWIGRHLALHAGALGCRDIGTETLPIISSQMEPQRRHILLDYLQSLLLSGAERLLAAGYAEPAQVKSLAAAFEQVRQDPAIEFRYFAVRLACSRPLAGSPV